MIDQEYELDLDTRKKLEENYKEIPASSILQKKTVKEKPVVDFTTGSEAFWREQDNGLYLLKYSEGILAGTFNDRIPSFASFMETIAEGMKVIVRSRYEDAELPPESIKPYTDAIELSIKMLINRMDSDITKDEIEDRDVISYYHGLLNSFITTNIERDK